MKIQAIQNQQTQTKPNFSAWGRVKNQQGILKVLKNDSQGVVDALNTLKKELGGIVRLEGPTVSDGFSNTSHFQSAISGDALVLGKDVFEPHRPLGIIIKRPDGSEITLLRTEKLSDRSITDKDFDLLAQSLEAKPNRTITLGREEETYKDVVVE